MARSGIAGNILDQLKITESVTVILELKVTITFAELIELQSDYDFWDLVKDMGLTVNDIKLISVTKTE